MEVAEGTSTEKRPNARVEQRRLGLRWPAIQVKERRLNTTEHDDLDLERLRRHWRMLGSKIQRATIDS